MGRTSKQLRNLSLEKKTALLLEIPFLAILSEEDRALLAEKLQPRSMIKGQPIFLQDDPGDEMYLLLEGRIKIGCESLSGREITLAFLDDGGFFGEMALLDGEPRSATAFCEIGGQLLVLRRADFLKFLMEVPTAGISLMTFLSQRLRRANMKIQDLALLNVRERLAALLLDLAEREGEPLQDRAGVTLPRTTSHKALSGLLGTSRETVSRMCSELKEQGLIAQEGRKIVVLDLEGLREIFADAGVR